MTPAWDPELRFRLPGDWFSIDVTSEATVDRCAHDLAVSLAGSGDAAAAIRVQIRDGLRAAVRDMRGGQPRAMYVGLELARGLALPVTLTVLEPRGLAIAPAMDDAPETVAAGLRETLERLRIGGHETAVEVDAREFRAIRTVHDVPVGPSRPERPRPLRVAYWCTVPRSKGIQVVAFATPLGVIRETMLAFFDAIVSAATYSTERRGA